MKLQPFSSKSFLNSRSNDKLRNIQVKKKNAVLFLSANINVHIDECSEIFTVLILHAPFVINQKIPFLHLSQFRKLAIFTNFVMPAFDRRDRPESFQRCPRFARPGSEDRGGTF